MERDIVIGDAVALVSDLAQKHPMTVVAIGTAGKHIVDVVWHSESGELQEASLHGSALEILSDEAE